MSARNEGTGNNKSKMRAGRAGIQFPLDRIDDFLRNGIHYRSKRVGVEAPVFMAAVVEYLVTEVLELASNVARHCKRIKRPRITPTHIHVAIRNDGELSKLLSKIIIAQGGNGVLSTFSAI